MARVITLREAKIEDVADISAMLVALRDAGLRTRPCDPDFVRDNYAANPRAIRSTLAHDGAALCGLQVLSFAWPDNPYGATEGWGTIGTHVAPDASRGGIGRKLFAETERAAREAHIEGIEAFIGADNPMGLGYYEAMGFRTVRQVGGAIVKAWRP